MLKSPEGNYGCCDGIVLLCFPCCCNNYSVLVLLVSCPFSALSHSHPVLVLWWFEDEFAGWSLSLPCWYASLHLDCVVSQLPIPLSLPLHFRISLLCVMMAKQSYGRLALAHRVHKLMMRFTCSCFAVFCLHAIMCAVLLLLFLPQVVLVVLCQNRQCSLKICLLLLLMYSKTHVIWPMQSNITYCRPFTVVMWSRCC